MSKTDKILYGGFAVVALAVIVAMPVSIFSPPKKSSRRRRANNQRWKRPHRQMKQRNRKTTSLPTGWTTMETKSGLPKKNTMRAYMPQKDSKGRNLSE